MLSGAEVPLMAANGPAGVAANRTATRATSNDGRDDFDAAQLRLILGNGSLNRRRRRGPNGRRGRQGRSGPSSP
jgi:hypothetical protein